MKPAAVHTKAERGCSLVAIRYLSVAVSLESSTTLYCVDLVFTVLGIAPDFIPILHRTVLIEQFWP
jgi:hypothetical protein